MLARLHRFHGHNTVTMLYKRGQTIRGQQITLKYSVRGDKPYRVAIVVSKKVSKSAAVRNRIRRRIYEQVRLQSAIIPNGADLLFSVFSDQLATSEPSIIAQNVANLLEKAFSGQQSDS